MSEQQHTVEHDGQPHYDDINTPLIFMLTGIAAILTYAVIAAISGLYFQMKNAEQAAINAETVTMASQQIATQKLLLSEGNQEKSIKPIGDAMKDVVEGLGGKWEAEPAVSDHMHQDDHAGGNSHGHGDAGEAQSEPEAAHDSADEAGH